ncbi:MAG: 5-amino-6-(5-phosphoribosylamino)uracil reductase [Candidatus Nanohalarchaeota archaeon]|nr:MAG: 5-amino-6-(5-phosphoribosylamino)uracil reductase [Candidatus Nanohaloarchaeota archaeon]
MHITINCAKSLDSIIEGNYSNKKDWKRVYELRAKSDAVMVGINTILKDNPRLTTHDTGKEPIKIVIDSRCRIPKDARIFETPAIIAVSENAPKESIAEIQKKAKVIVCGRDKVDLCALIKQLSETGINKLMVEGGGTLISSILDLNLADELIVAIAPQITSKGIRFIEKELDAPINLKLKDVQKPDDVVVLKYEILK